MTIKDEALRMALEALESVTGHFTRTPSTLRDSEVLGEAHKAITAIREALRASGEVLMSVPDGAHPERPAVPAVATAIAQGEPVAWYDEEYDCAYTAAELDGGNVDGLLPLYTSPQPSQSRSDVKPWVGLTDEQISNILDGHVVPVFGKNGINPIVFARAIEAKLKEKNGF